MSESKYMCARCGLPVTEFVSTTGWKHCANGHTKSCGKPPAVVGREKYHAEMDAIAATVKIDAIRL